MESITPNQQHQPTIYKGLFIVFFFGFVNGFYKQQLFEISPIVFWLQDIFNFIILPSSVLYFFYAKLNFKPSDYGFIKTSQINPLSEVLGSTIFTAIILGAVYLIVNFVAHHFLNKYGYQYPLFNYSSSAPEGILKLAVVLYFAASAAIVEEIIYRAIPYTLIMQSNHIKQKHQKIFFVMATSIVFSIIHWESGFHELLSTFSFGLVAALFYLSYKNIWPLIGAHFLVDMYVFW